MAIRENLIQDAERYKNLLEINDLDLCRTCNIAKLTAKPHPTSKVEHFDKIGTHFSTDVCGPFPIRSIGGKNYFITFTDRKTRRSFIYFVAKKSDAPTVFCTFLVDIRTSYGFE